MTEPIEQPDRYTAIINYTSAAGWEWSEVEEFLATSIERAEEQAIELATDTMQNPFEPAGRRPVRADIDLSGARIGYLENINIDATGDVTMS